MKDPLRVSHYKYLMILMKYMPIIMLIFQLVYLLLSFYDIRLYVLRWLADMSIFTCILFLSLVKVFKFCIIQKGIVFYDTFIYFFHDRNLILSNILFLTGIVLLLWSCLHCIKYKLY
jgi:hypothetical protein